MSWDLKAIDEAARAAAAAAATSDPGLEGVTMDTGLVDVEFAVVFDALALLVMIAGRTLGVVGELVVVGGADVEVGLGLAVADVDCATLAAETEAIDAV